jgi:integrase
MSAIYRRNRTYWIRAQRDGRRYRISLKTADRKVAERRARTLLNELDAIAWGEKPRRSYAEAEEKFIKEHLTAIKPRAAQRYGVSLKHLAEHFGDKTLDQITSAALSAFETDRRIQGVSSSTIRRDLACLSSLVTSCVDWEWIDSNPVPAYLRRRAKRGLKEGAARTRYVAEAEEPRLLAAATPREARLGKRTSVREAIILAIDTGLRRDELFSLQWSQVDLDRRRITTTTMTKNGRPRVVPLPERSRSILAALPRNGNYVLINPDTKTRYRQMNKGFKAAVRRAGLSDLEWHDLRRTAGCRWLQRDGKRMEEVSILLGHSSVKVTEERYAFLEADKVAASIANGTKTATANG